MIHHQLGNNFQAAAVSFIKKLLKIFESPVIGINGHIVSYIVAVVPER